MPTVKEPFEILTDMVTGHNIHHLHAWPADKSIRLGQATNVGGGKIIERIGTDAFHDRMIGFAKGDYFDLRDDAELERFANSEFGEHYKTIREKYGASADSASNRTNYAQTLQNAEMLNLGSEFSSQQAAFEEALVKIKTGKEIRVSELTSRVDSFDTSARKLREILKRNRRVLAQGRPVKSDRPVAVVQTAMMPDTHRVMLETIRSTIGRVTVFPVYDNDHSGIDGDGIRDEFKISHTLGASKLPSLPCEGFMTVVSLGEMKIHTICRFIKELRDLASWEFLNFVYFPDSSYGLKCLTDDDINSVLCSQGRPARDAMCRATINFNPHVAVILSYKDYCGMMIVPTIVSSDSDSISGMLSVVNGSSENVRSLPHPHVNTNGEVCYGEYAAAAKQRIYAGNYLSLLQLAKSVLSGYNRQTAYRDVSGMEHQISQQSDLYVSNYIKSVTIHHQEGEDRELPIC